MATREEEKEEKVQTGEKKIEIMKEDTLARQPGGSRKKKERELI